MEHRVFAVQGYLAGLPIVVLGFGVQGLEYLAGRPVVNIAVANALFNDFVKGKLMPLDILCTANRG